MKILSSFNFKLLEGIIKDNPDYVDLEEDDGEGL